MSRSGYGDSDYGDEFENLAFGRFHRVREQTFRGKRGQAFLREMLTQLEALPEKRLIAGDLIKDSGAMCAIGTVGTARGIDMSQIDPEDAQAVSKVFGISETMAREIMNANDDEMHHYTHGDETAEQRYTRMLSWVRAEIVAA